MWTMVQKSLLLGTSLFWPVPLPHPPTQLGVLPFCQLQVSHCLQGYGEEGDREGERGVKEERERSHHTLSSDVEYDLFLFLENVLQ